MLDILADLQRPIMKTTSHLPPLIRSLYKNLIHAVIKSYVGNFNQVSCFQFSRLEINSFPVDQRCLVPIRVPIKMDDDMALRPY